MPPAKKRRSHGPGSKPESAETDSAVDRVVPPTAPDSQDEESEFAKLAHSHWLKPKRKNAKTKVKNDVLGRDIWEPLERDGFPYKALLELESLNILEKLCLSCLVCPCLSGAHVLWLTLVGWT